MKGHPQETHRYPGTEPLSYPRQFPECSQEACLVSVQDPGPEAANVGTGADEKHNHRQQTLEVEQG